MRRYVRLAALALAVLLILTAGVLATDGAVENKNSGAVETSDSTADKSAYGGPVFTGEAEQPETENADTSKSTEKQPPAEEPEAPAEEPEAQETAAPEQSPAPDQTQTADLKPGTAGPGEDSKVPEPSATALADDSKAAEPSASPEDPAPAAAGNVWVFVLLGVLAAGCIAAIVLVNRKKK